MILGAGESGKSTLWRQLKILFCDGFNNSERKAFVKTIRQTIVSDIQFLIDFMEQNSQNLSVENQSFLSIISDVKVTEVDFDSELANAILNVWKDPIMKIVAKNANSIGLGENSSFFFDKVIEISGDDYSPSNEDILKARIRTVGISNLFFKIQDIKTILVDVGGQLNERRNWVKTYQNVSYLMFVVSLSDFDQKMFENGTSMRTEDAIELFCGLINSSYFVNKPVYLILNKIDIFEVKLKENPNAFLESYPGFKGDISQVDQAVEHVKNAFLSKVTAERTPEAWIETISVSAMDESKVSMLLEKIARKIIDDQKQNK